MGNNGRQGPVELALLAGWLAFIRMDEFRSSRALRRLHV